MGSGWLFRRSEPRWNLSNYDVSSSTATSGLDPIVKLIL